MDPGAGKEQSMSIGLARPGGIAAKGRVKVSDSRFGRKV